MEVSSIIRFSPISLDFMGTEYSNIDAGTHTYVFFPSPLHRTRLCYAGQGYPLEISYYDSGYLNTMGSSIKRTYNLGPYHMPQVHVSQTVGTSAFGQLSFLTASSSGQASYGDIPLGYNGTLYAGVASDQSTRMARLFLDDIAYDNIYNVMYPEALVNIIDTDTFQPTWTEQSYKYSSSIYQMRYMNDEPGTGIICKSYVDNRGEFIPPFEYRFNFYDVKLEYAQATDYDAAGLISSGGGSGSRDYKDGMNRLLFRSNLLQGHIPWDTDLLADPQSIITIRDSFTFRSGSKIQGPPKPENGFSWNSWHSVNARGNPFSIQEDTLTSGTDPDGSCLVYSSMNNSGSMVTKPNNSGALIFQVSPLQYDSSSTKRLVTWYSIKFTVIWQYWPSPQKTPSTEFERLTYNNPRYIKENYLNWRWLLLIYQQYGDAFGDFYAHVVKNCNLERRWKSFNRFLHTIKFCWNLHTCGEFYTIQRILR